ncbi:MAG TPA: hypothetical protein DEB39_06140, partial [Planctomycetaceae bacterium]|nr:hypothetical protein [Planctomycetaceae bacterium]
FNHYSRLNAACGKVFKSSCGAQLFCSLQCQLQSEIGRQMFAMVDGDRILRQQKERRRAQVRQAVKKYKKTSKGIEVNKRSHARYRAKQKNPLPESEAESGMRRPSI